MRGSNIIIRGISLVLLGSLLWLQTSDSPLINNIRERLDNIAYDIRLASTLPKTTSETPRIVIIDIDEKSLKETGQWPWPRNKMALLTDQLFEAGALVVGFDIVFAEKDRNSAREVLNHFQMHEIQSPDTMSDLKNMIPEFNYDEKFSNSFKDRDVVLGYVLHNRSHTLTGKLPPPLTVTNINDAMLASLPEAEAYTANLAIMHKHHPAGGFFTTRPDRDGIIRKTPLILRYKDKIYPSLALEITRLFLLLDEVSIDMHKLGRDNAMEHLILGKNRIPTDGLGNVLIPYQGRQNTFQTLSASDILNKRIAPARINNKIILIGTSAQGLFDMRTTPLQANVPGVEIHASLVHALIQGKFPYEPSWAAGANFFMILIIGLVLILLLPRLSAVWIIVSSTLLLFAVVVANFSLWHSQGLVLALSVPLITVFALSSYYLARGFISETLNRKKISSIFGQYVPPHLVEQMNRDPEHYHVQGETRELTVLFADIVGFTAISEKLSANELKDLLNRFFTPMTRIIFTHKGTIDKYVGDMIMAFWGAPVVDDKHASHSLDAAMDMLKEVKQLQHTFALAGYPAMQIGIGINTGIMSVGDMGSEFRRAYTVLGDAVNLASRLEGLTRYYGCDLIVSEHTKQQCDDYVFQELDRVCVKGKQEPVTIYSPVCRKAEAVDLLLNELELHERGLGHYRLQNWIDAGQCFSTLRKNFPGKILYEVYLDRISKLRQQDLAGDWNGVYDRRSK